MKIFHLVSLSRLFVTVEYFFLYAYISVHMLVVHLLIFLSHLPACHLLGHLAGQLRCHLACFLGGGGAGRESRFMLDKWLVSMVWCGVLYAMRLQALYGP